MTRKDYIRIAEVLNTASAYSAHDPAAEAMRRNIALDLTVTLRADNPRFSPDRFLTAANVYVSEVNY